MKYYNLFPRDTRDPNFILYDSPDMVPELRRLTLKKRYQRFACKGCGKVPIERIYKTEFDSNPKLDMGRWDLNCTDDHVHFCNERFLDFLKNEEIAGVNPIQKVDGKWWVIDFEILYTCSEFRELHSECSVCGRPMETCGLPHWWNITLPSSAKVERAIMMSDLVCENSLGASGQMIASESVIQSMKKARITGCEFTPVRVRKG
jgi:hypothetical protein